MLKHNVRFWLLRTIAIALASAASSVAVSKPGVAQNVIIPDATLGSEASQVIPIPFAPVPEVDFILGGAVRGQNLFHSFEQFNIGDVGGAYFIVPSAGISNIFTRITGSDPSEILGVLGTRQTDFSASNADLFLINPSGIIFGESATLDLGGSFVATTASGVQFGDEGSFSATSPDAPSPSLSINPSAYFFSNFTQEGIVSRSTRADRIDGASRGLRVPDGENITFLGGDILLDGGGLGSGLHAHGGQIQIGAVNSNGNVGIDVNRNLIFPVALDRASILLTDEATVDVRTRESNGSISFFADNIRLENNSLLIAGIRTRSGTEDSQAGNILLDASGTVEVSQSEITNSLSISSTGKGGDILIFGSSLSVEDALLRAFSLGQGDVGDILITVSELTSFSNAGAFAQNGVSVDIGSLAAGDSGKIIIESGSLLLANGSTLSNSTLGIGNAGEIRLNVDQEVFIDDNSAVFSDVGSRRFNQGVIGNAGNIRIFSNRLHLNNSSGLQTATFAQGNAGNIILDIKETILFEGNSFALTNVEFTGIGSGGSILINANNVAVNNGSQLAAGTRGKGDAGSILINATGDISLDGAGPFLSGGIFSTVESAGFGNGGNITILAGNLFVENDAQLAAGTRGEGNAGNVLIEVIDRILFDDGAIFSTVETRRARGNGSNISIVAGNLLFLNGSQIVASTNGIGNAGDIFIETSGATIFDGVSSDGNRPSSAITAVLTQGNGSGGTIEINSGSLLLTNGGRLLAETRGRGDAGNIRISSDSVTISRVDENSGRRSEIISGNTDRSTGQGGTIFIDTSTLEVSDGALISARTNNSENGGEITVNASSIDLINQAAIEALSTSSGNSGSIFLSIEGQLIARDSEISTTSSFSSGGQIDIIANGIVLFGDSDIQTFVELGNRNSGNINIKSNFLIAFNDSDILAFASEGAGGNIRIQALGFFGENFTLDSLTAPPQNLDGNDRVDINATGAASGVVTIPNISVIENSMTSLQDTIIDTNALTAGSCIANVGATQSTFVVTGSGGLPARPGDGVISSYPTSSVQPLPATEPQAVWQPGDPIVEPTGAFSLPDGRLVLARECDEPAGSSTSQSVLEPTG